jgi:hypothetical protein
VFRHDVYYHQMFDRPMEDGGFSSLLLDDLLQVNMFGVLIKSNFYEKCVIQR